MSIKWLNKRYIFAIQGGIIALIIFAIATIFIPGQGPLADVQIILTASTFLFAILAGFFISRSNNRYDEIRSEVAEEDALILSIYRMSDFFGDSFQKKISGHIDDYYIEAMDFDVGAGYKNTTPHMEKIYQAFHALKKIKDSKIEDLYDDIFMLLSDLEESRNKASVLRHEKMTYGQWAILIVLVSIIIFCLFFLKIPAVYSQVITVMLSTTLVLVLLFLRDIQNLRLYGEHFLLESAEEVFESIGKERYYPEYYFNEGFLKEVPEHVKQYRLGTHQPGEKHKIKLIKVKR